MLNFIIKTSFTEAIIFLSYILICTALFKRRFSLRTTAIAFTAAGIVIVGVQAAIILSGEEMLAFTMLPLTAYLPFSVLLYFLSDCGLLETAAVCSVGMLDVLILKLLYKIFYILVIKVNLINSVQFAAINAVIAIAAAGLVFAAFKYIGKAFRFCVIENRQNRLLLLAPIALIFVMSSWFLNSTATPIILFLAMLIAILIFLIIARLLGTAAELIRTKRAEKEMSEHMEIQLRDYDRLLRKMEAGRAYRHDMRHHLKTIEGLVKQGDYDKVIEYTGKMSGSLTEIESIRYCKSPELNAVLSEYISRARDAGCRVAHNIALTDKLPFAEDDVCIVIANSVENAINACAKFPEKQRYISIFAQCADNHRLLVSVKNPCADTPEFDGNGLPVVERPSEEHGIGLRSVNSIAEKYNGFLRCKVENGEFVFHAALFCDKSVSAKKDAKSENVSKRAVSSLLGFGLGTLILLNILPSTAGAASSLLSVNIRTIGSFDLDRDSSLMSIGIPAFTGGGSEKLNGAVKNYNDETQEKFLLYFNQKYNGCAAENIQYTVIRNDEKYYIVQFKATVNTGGSTNYSRWAVYDKSAGKVLELSELFRDGSDYVGVISAEILEDMERNKVVYEHMYGSIFYEGGNAFTEINEDANFYIDSFNRLVIVLDEYENSPGSTSKSSPEFFIPYNDIKDIVR